MLNHSQALKRARALVAGALLIAGIAQAQSIEDDRTALAKAKAQSILAEQRAARLEASASAELSEAEAAKTAAAAIAARIEGAEADIKAGETRINLIARLQSEQAARLAAKQEPAVRLTAALQTLARRPPALALVQPGSIDDLVHVRAVMATVVPVLRARTAGLRQEITASAKLKHDAQRAIVALDASKQKLATQKTALTQLAARHRAQSDLIMGSAMAEQDRAMAMGERARDIADLMSQLEADAEVRNRLASLSGPLPRPARPSQSGGTGLTDLFKANDASTRIPYRLPVAGTVMTGMGEAAESGARSRGLTIATRPDAIIVAPNGGRITFAGPYRSYGNIVIIDHGSGWTSLITSVSVLDVRTGDNLIQGSPLGRAGTERPTVTVELRHNDKPVDIGNMVG